MFSIISLININFSILRSIRNALVVADVGGSAVFIPYFELLGTFPASILMTWGISRLMRKFSLRFIFSTTMLFFLFFFLLFAFWIYPNKNELHSLIEEAFGMSRFKIALMHWPDMTFYIVSELWKVALLSVVFWSFVNQNISLEEAKRFYPPLMLGNSLGAILAGPITVLCTSEANWKLLPLSSDHWHHSLCLLSIFLLISGLLTLFLFNILYKKLSSQTKEKNIQDSLELEKEPFSQKLLTLTSCFKHLLKSSYLSALAVIVIAEYISYALGELMFLDTLKKEFPSPAAYCNSMGSLSLWSGILTALSAVVITPYLLENFRWKRVVLITPILMVAMTGGFFSILFMGKLDFIEQGDALRFAVLVGSIHFCLCRAAKYTLFDATKELAFIPLPQEDQVKGKLMIDGIGSRFGRGTSSLLSIILFTILGGPGESVIFVGILALIFAAISIPSTKIIGDQFEEMSRRIKLAAQDRIN